MGPPPFGDGNPDFSIPCLRIWCRFNGATAFRRWKHLSALVGWFRCAYASMGPPPFGDGNARTASLALSCHRGFNGATAFRRWKRSHAVTASSFVARLQWGHRLSAMETPKCRVRHPRLSPASMGPPPFGDGNAAEPSQINNRGLASMGPPPFGDGNGRRPRYP